jgi:hypothetical protein
VFVGEVEIPSAIHAGPLPAPTEPRSRGLASAGSVKIRTLKVCGSHNDGSEHFHGKHYCRFYRGAMLGKSAEPRVTDKQGFCRPSMRRGRISAESEFWQTEVACFNRGFQVGTHIEVA